MPTIKLTQAAVDRLKPPTEGNATYWDNQCPGFGVRISARGRRTWIAMYRVNKKSVMETIGTTGLLPSVADARQRARESMTKARDGINPVERRREAEAAEEQAKVAADEGIFHNVAKRFLREHVERNCAPKHAAEFRRILEHDVLWRWGDKQIRSINRQDVNDLIDAKANSRERERKGARGGAVVQRSEEHTSELQS